MNTTEITDEQVAEFFRRKLATITNEIPDACSFEAVIWNNSTGFGFQAYSKHYKHGRRHASSDAAIESLLAMARSKSPEEVRRERVEELRAELLRLEAESLPA